MPILLRVFSVCLLAFLTSGAVAFSKTDTAPIDPVYAKIQKDVPYKASGPATTMDLYYPAEGKGPYPTHVYLHGGGWRGGSKNISGDMSAVFKKLAEAGFLGVAVEYQLVDAKQGRYMRTCAVDSFDALRYLFANAEALGIDPNNVFVWGGSAGGHLTLLCATAPLSTLPGDLPDPEGGAPIKAAVAWFPPTDMLNYEQIGLEFNGKTRDLSQRIGRTTEEDPVAFIEISPLEHLTKNDPPTLLIHGNSDKVVHLEHSRRFAEKAKTLGVPSELIVVENADHSFRTAKGTPGISPSRREIVDKTAAFFIEQSKLPSPSKAAPEPTAAQ